jgi:hypothetical protein
MILRTIDRTNVLCYSVDIERYPYFFSGRNGPLVFKKRPLPETRIRKLKMSAVRVSLGVRDVVKERVITKNQVRRDSHGSK